MILFLAALLLEVGIVNCFGCRPRLLGRLAELIVVDCRNVFKLI